jgi:hypothetical protein
MSGNMIEAFRTRARVGIVGVAIAFVFLPVLGCAPETPVIDTSTKGGMPGSIPSPTPEKVQIQSKPSSGTAPGK